MQQNIQFYRDLLHATGGDLIPEKCAWYLITHRWSKGKPSPLNIEEQHSSIILNSEGTDFVVKRKELKEPHKTLGFHITGCNHMKGQITHMKEKVKLYGAAIHKAHIQKTWAPYSYNTFYI